MGKILLNQDLQLKKDMAKFLHPQNPVGKLFWERLYSEAGKLLGKDKLKKTSITTSNRVWIVPEEAVVMETEDGAFVASAKLRVLLESEYLSLKAKQWNKEVEVETKNKDQIQALSEQLMKDIVIPEMTKEVNVGSNYASLRQIYHSLILAHWFKLKHRNSQSIYSEAIDKAKIEGLESELPWEKQAIWQDYLASYKNGEYKLKEKLAGINRMYFSGGIGFFSDPTSSPLKVIPSGDNLPSVEKDIPGLANLRPIVTETPPANNQKGFVRPFTSIIMSLLLAGSMALVSNIGAEPLQKVPNLISFRDSAMQGNIRAFEILDTLASDGNTDAVNILKNLKPPASLITQVLKKDIQAIYLFQHLDYYGNPFAKSILDTIEVNDLILRAIQARGNSDDLVLAFVLLEELAPYNIAAKRFLQTTDAAPFVRRVIEYKIEDGIYFLKVLAIHDNPAAFNALKDLTRKGYGAAFSDLQLLGSPAYNKKEAITALEDLPGGGRKHLVVKKSYQWLSSQIDSSTGLVKSFVNLPKEDPSDGVTWMYNQAQEIQAALAMEDIENAEKLGRAVLKLKRNNGTWYNGYMTETGIPADKIPEQKASYTGAMMAVGHGLISLFKETNDEILARDLLKAILELKTWLDKYYYDYGNYAFVSGGDGSLLVTTEYNQRAFAFYYLLYDLGKLGRDYNQAPSARPKHWALLNENLHLINAPELKIRADKIIEWIQKYMWSKDHYLVGYEDAESRKLIPEIITALPKDHPDYWKRQAWGYAQYLGPIMAHIAGLNPDKFSGGLDWLFAHSTELKIGDKTYKGIPRWLGTPSLWGKGTFEAAVAFRLTGREKEAEQLMGTIAVLKDETGGIKEAVGDPNYGWPINFPYLSIEATQPYIIWQGKFSPKYIATLEQNYMKKMILPSASSSITHGGIDLSKIELTLKDEKFVSSLNPADLKILRAARALNQGWSSLSLLYVHEVMLLLKYGLIQDITQRQAAIQVMRQLKLKQALDPQAASFCSILQSGIPIPKIKPSFLK